MTPQQAINMRADHADDQVQAHLRDGLPIPEDVDVIAAAVRTFNPSEVQDERMRAAVMELHKTFRKLTGVEPLHGGP